MSSNYNDAENYCKDLISRQSVIRWVKTECNPYGKPTLDFESGKRVIKHLEQMPSAQSEIVRCKDCKHYHVDVWGSELGIEGIYGNLIVAHNACDRWSEYMNSIDPDGFCFLAERRTDE